jgi:hypothetical protein
MPFSFTTANGTAHSAPIQNLADGHSYTFYARCRDQSGNLNADDFPISFQVAAAAPPGGSTVRINCGGSTYDYTDPTGLVWLRDRFYSQGGTAYASTVGGTNSTWLYQTGRQGVWSDFSYSIPVTSGSYRVTLKFAELYKTAPGQRVFHVDINGSRVLTNFDILTHVAAKTAFDASFVVAAASGSIEIQFLGVVDRGIVSAIEVVPAVP